MVKPGYDMKWKDYFSQNFETHSLPVQKSMEPPISSQSEAAGHRAPGDANHTSRQDIEDFLAKFSCLVAHQGFSQIANVLTQVTELQRNHDSLVEETQRRVNAHEKEIADLEEKDEELRRKSLKDYTESVEELNKEKDRLTQGNKHLKTEVERHMKATRIAEQQVKTQLVIVDTLRNEMQQHEERAISANQEHQEVQKGLSDAQQSAKRFEDMLKRRDLTESRLKEEVAAARSETQELQKRNERLQKKLDKIKVFVVQANDVASADLTKELDEVWWASLNLVRCAVAENLPESTLKNKALWQNMESLGQGLPLPHSDSPGARSMRAVLILSVMAQAFVRHIFTTTYLLSEAGQLDKVLTLLAEQDSSHELFARSVLLQVHANNQVQMITSRVAGMVEEVISHIQVIISPGRLDEFKSGLKEVAEKSAQTWYKFQRNKTHFKVTCEVDSDAGWGWKILKLPIESAKTLGDPIPLEPQTVVVTVFPQVLSVDDVEDKSISPGIVAAKSQFAEAEEEVRLGKGFTCCSGEKEFNAISTADEGRFSCPGSNLRSNAARFFRRALIRLRKGQSHRQFADH